MPRSNREISLILVPEQEEGTFSSKTIVKDAKFKQNDAKLKYTKHIYFVIFKNQCLSSSSKTRLEC